MPGVTRILPEVDFDKDGVQNGYLRLFHSTHASAYGFIPIPIVVIRNGRGPTAFFMSGNHGDEYEGQVALCNLAKSLKPADITGRVILLPAANYAAAMAGRRVSPIDDLNLNRIFPGDPDGTVTQHIAHTLRNELMPLADIFCDLHSGGSSLMYVPSALIKSSTDPARQEKLVAALKAFAAPHAYMAAAGPGGDATASGGAERKGVLTVSTELGGPAPSPQPPSASPTRPPQPARPRRHPAGESKRYRRATARPASSMSAARTITATRRRTGSSKPSPNSVTWSKAANSPDASTSPSARGFRPPKSASSVPASCSASASPAAPLAAIASSTSGPTRHERRRPRNADPYRALGVRPFINCASVRTAHSGSRCCRRSALRSHRPREPSSGWTN